MGRREKSEEEEADKTEREINERQESEKEEGKSRERHGGVFTRKGKGAVCVCQCLTVLLGD